MLQLSRGLTRDPLPEVSLSILKAPKFTYLIIKSQDGLSLKIGGEGNEVYNRLAELAEAARPKSVAEAQRRPDEVQFSDRQK